MTLADLKTGKSGIIVKINVSGALKRRLMDMGVVTGDRGKSSSAG